MITFNNFKFILNIFKKYPNQIKYVPRWLTSVSRNNDYVLRQQLPWIVFSALDSLDTINLTEKKVFEYGSGGSTFYWLKKGATCVSIEHDKQWYYKMKPLLDVFSEVDYRLIQPNQLSSDTKTKNPADPNDYCSNSLEWSGYDFTEYVSQIDEFPDKYFDVINIDGRARPSCIRQSFNKLAVGGLMIVDNSDRQYYFEETLPYLKDFSRQEFLGLGPMITYVWKTDFFTRLS